METILELLTEKMNKESFIKIITNIFLCRIYNKGAILQKHKDRYSCRLSTTLNLGGDMW